MSRSLARPSDGTPQPRANAIAERVGRHRTPRVHRPATDRGRTASARGARRVRVPLQCHRPHRTLGHQPPKPPQSHSLHVDASRMERRPILGSRSTSTRRQRNHRQVYEPHDEEFWGSKFICYSHTLITRGTVCSDWHSSRLRSHQYSARLVFQSVWHIALPSGMHCAVGIECRTVYVAPSGHRLFQGRAL
jgi:hypothetical protein